jgi:hypothetical protein
VPLDGSYLNLFPVKLVIKADSVARGFDALVNGAMIGVPSFRRDFGSVCIAAQ